ncbi:hypothetical protein [Pontibacter litorisediminis]|uniref:hypothetical protein n=1 Tax=Pontibacter litorisediminis TaxID=1846260 RepID=UPI0023EDFC83|nr:hypothetical protein [Pontibacter litorisediminis]
MEHFEYLNEQQQQQKALKSRLRLLHGRRAGTDGSSKEHRLLGEEINQVQESLSALEQELHQYLTSFN